MHPRARDRIPDPDPRQTGCLWLQTEWTAVTDAVHGIAHCLRSGTTAGDFVADLMTQAVWVRNWWADRNAKAVPGAAHKFRPRATCTVIMCALDCLWGTWPTVMAH